MKEIVNPKGPLSLVLLVATRDAKDCCAQNMERTLFRDPKIVKFAQGYTSPYRFDRDQALGKALYEKYQLIPEKAALLLFDNDGDLLYARQKCTEPRDYIKGLQFAVGLARKKISYVSRGEHAIERAQAAIDKEDYRGALQTLDSLERPYLRLPLRERVDGQYAAIEKAAKSALETAADLEKKEEFKAASEAYWKVSLEFSRMEKIRAEARTAWERVRKLSADG
ncbi:MAG: hypothetical protein JXP34_02950 [Planctomycetes bacterium]|nr:hypothetical protein [Planctomycetota bacterium]